MELFLSKSQGPQKQGKTGKKKKDGGKGRT